MAFRFDDYALDRERRELARSGAPVAVEPQVLDLLVYLIEHRDRVVGKDELIATVWCGRIVSDSTLASRINAARRAVGDSGEQQRLIRTYPRKGVRFIGEVDAARGPFDRVRGRQRDVADGGSPRRAEVRLPAVRQSVASHQGDQRRD